MSLTKRILIGIGCLLLFAIILAGAYFVKRHATGIAQDCPHDVRKCNDSDHLYHVNTGKCFLKGESPEGVCGRNMVILPLSTCRIQGECECDYESHERLLLYHAKTERCYFIYEQGPCNEGYVITLSRQNIKATCEPDLCHGQKTKVSDEEKKLIVPYDNKCYPLFTTLNETNCKGELKFWKNQLNPSCSPPASYKTGGFSSFISSQCHPGSIQTRNGLCLPLNAITFELPSVEDDDY